MEEWMIGKCGLPERELYKQSECKLMNQNSENDPNLTNKENAELGELLDKPHLVVGFSQHTVSRFGVCDS